MTRLHVPGVSADVEVRASARRRRTVTAFREQGRLVVVVPARMPRAEIAGYVEELVGRLQARENRRRHSDTALAERAAELSALYLDGRARPASVRWVDNQNSRWGSTTPVHGTIRLSARLATMPAYVVDAVLVHELAHLLVPGHGSDFKALEARYPRLAEAQAFLAGYEHARAATPDDPAAPDCADNPTRADDPLATPADESAPSPPNPIDLRDPCAAPTLW